MKGVKGLYFDRRRWVHRRTLEEIDWDRRVNRIKRAHMYWKLRKGLLNEAEDS